MLETGAALSPEGSEAPPQISAPLPPAAPTEPAEPEVLGSGFTINPDKSLLIRDPAIVDNATRTLDPCDARRRGLAPGAVTSAQTWTFGHLMTQMANGRDPGVFAYNWLAAWSLGARIGQDSVLRLRAGDGKTLPGRLYEAWQRSSNGTPGGTINLAMNRAPFRLLAIVSRFDLRKNRRFGEGNSGELRFIFSVLDLDRTEADGIACLEENSRDAPTSRRGDQLLILEYAVDHLSDTARRDWISQWITLDGLEFTDPAFAAALEGLTQSVVRAGAGTGRPNGSALIRLRTNESTDALDWHLREFTINATTGYLVPTPVKQTPKASFLPADFDVPNGLRDWISQSGTAILNDTHTVPAQYLGGRSVNRSLISSWTPPLEQLGIAPAVAFEFSRRTCVGCHSADTGSSFFHVHGRPFRQTAEISHFLDGQWPNQPTGCPHDSSGQPHCFSEFDDRAADILSYLNGGG